MKILYIAHRVPYPPNKGDKIRSFNELKHLSKRHELHLLAFYEYPEEARYDEELKRYCRSVRLVPLARRRQMLKALYWMARGRPWSLGYFSDSAMREAVDAALAQSAFDLIFVYCSSVAPYACQAGGIPKILDFVDSDSLKWKKYSEARKPPLRWLYGYEARKLSAYECRTIGQFERSIFVSPAEIGTLCLQGDRSKVAFIQNGVDLDFFKPSAGTGATLGIAFTGAMDYFPNVDGALFFAREVFPRIRAVYPDARFFVIGSRPTPPIRRLSSEPGITVTGTVPDVRPFLSRCRVAVVPLRIAQGIQNKILEALAMGLPVVTTPQAAGGLGSSSELPLFLATGPEDFAGRVIDCMAHAPLPAHTVEDCRRHLRERYDWEANLSLLDRIIDAVTSDPGYGGPAGDKNNY